MSTAIEEVVDNDDNRNEIVIDNITANQSISDEPVVNEVSGNNSNSGAQSSTIDPAPIAESFATEVVTNIEDERSTKDIISPQEGQHYLQPDSVISVENIDNQIKQIAKESEAKESTKPDKNETTISNITPDKSHCDETASAQITIPDELLGATASIPDKNNDLLESIYNVKWIKFDNVLLPIVTQNENGPCPLLAIMNYLFLQQKIQLPPSTEVITSNKLISYLADYIFEHVPKHIKPDTRLNYEQKMHDAVAMFPKLQTGLDVNVRFTGVSHFEYTPSCEIFDLINIPLYHGWLVDPEMKAVQEAVNNATYNQLVEMVINLKCSNQPEQVERALIAEEFLNSTASQMTYHGLLELALTLNDSQMGVLFRNNHFHTLLKHNGALYVLATDQGFLNEPQVVWETLSNIEGDSHFCDANFRIFQSTAPPPQSISHVKQSDLTSAINATAVVVPKFANSAEQIDHDYLVALSMEQEQAECSQNVTQWTDLGLTDEELAMKLQEEENSYGKSNDPKQNKQQQHSPSTAVDKDTNSKQSSQTSSTKSNSSGAKVKKDKDSACHIM